MTSQYLDEQLQFLYNRQIPFLAYASVLHLRGENVSRQPFLFQVSNKKQNQIIDDDLEFHEKKNDIVTNFLQYNGEIYESKKIDEIKEFFIHQHIQKQEEFDSIY